MATKFADISKGPNGTSIYLPMTTKKPKRQVPRGALGFPATNLGDANAKVAFFLAWIRYGH